MAFSFIFLLLAAAGAIVAGILVVIFLRGDDK